MRLTDMKHTTAVAGDPEHWAGDEQLAGRKGPRLRRLLPAAAAAVVVVAVTVGVGLGTGPEGQTRRVSSLTGSSVGVAPDPAVTAPDQTELPAAQPSAPGATVAAPSSMAPRRAGAQKRTEAHKRTAAPDRSRPAGMTYEPEAVWPETVAELDRLQAEVDQGHQPWRNDPVAVARAYLVDRGLPAAAMGRYLATAVDVGSVDYTAGSVAGRVDLHRLLGGSIWYVTASRTDRLPGVKVARQGGTLVIEVQSSAEGTLTARAKRPGRQLEAEASRQVFTGGYGSLTLGSGAMSGELIVQLRHDGAGTGPGIAEMHLGSSTDSVQYSAVDAESRLRLDGLGPVRIGMALEEARAASGLPLVITEGPACGGYRSDGPPSGLVLGSLNSGRVDFISVSEPSIATASGIRVGSSLAEVRKAYGDNLHGSAEDGHGKLVFRSPDPATHHLSLGLWISDGTVIDIWAGLRGPVESDEACA